MESAEPGRPGALYDSLVTAQTLSRLASGILVVMGNFQAYDDMRMSPIPGSVRVVREKRRDPASWVSK